MPKLKRTCVAIGSSSGDDGHAVWWSVPGPDGMLKRHVRLIATEVGEQGHLFRLQSRSVWGTNRTVTKICSFRTLARRTLALEVCCASVAREVTANK